MMTILDALGSAEYKQHVSLLATLIKLSEVDGVIAPEEWEIIEKIAFKYGLNDPEGLKFLKKNAGKYRLSTPYTLDERIDQYYQLLKLAYADGQTDEKELELIKRSIISLGFPTAKADDIFNKGLELVKSGAEYELFYKEIKNIVLSKE